MPSNIEIKATIADREALIQKVAELATQGPTALTQDDTFFHCPNGRLKLREVGSTEGQLIFYSRPDTAGPKLSEYTIAHTDCPDRLRDTLSLALGVTGRVRKTRMLYLVGRTRVHIDRVQGLGDFLELEVVLSPGESHHQAELEAHALLRNLGVPADALVSRAYVDLLPKAPGTT